MKTTLEWWIARDEEPIKGTAELWLYINKPIRSDGIFYDTEGSGIPLPEDLFPLKKGNEPQKVKVTIETMEEVI